MIAHYFEADFLIKKYDHSEFVDVLLLCSGFLPFGKGAGDSYNSVGDDETAASINLTVPVKFYEVTHNQLHVRAQLNKQMHRQRFRCTNTYRLTGNLECGKLSYLMIMQCTGQKFPDFLRL